MENIFKLGPEPGKRHAYNKSMHIKKDVALPLRAKKWIVVFYK